MSLLRLILSFTYSVNTVTDYLLYARHYVGPGGGGEEENKTKSLFEWSPCSGRLGYCDLIGLFPSPSCFQANLLAFVTCHLQIWAKNYHISNSTWYLLGSYTKFCKGRGVTWLEGIFFILFPRGCSTGFDDL